MNKICTSIEQSKKLLELGININTADMIHNVLGESYVRHDTPIDKYHTPAWSLSALLGILSEQMYFLDEDGRISLSSYKGNRWNITSINAIDKKPLEADYPLDAAFEMVVWLKENNKL